MKVITKLGGIVRKENGILYFDDKTEQELLEDLKKYTSLIDDPNAHIIFLDVEINRTSLNATQYNCVGGEKDDNSPTFGGKSVEEIQDTLKKCFEEIHEYEDRQERVGLEKMDREELHITKYEPQDITKLEIRILQSISYFESKSFSDLKEIS